MKVLKRGKSTLTLFIIAVALASCQKETSKPSGTQKDVTAQARATPTNMNEGLGVVVRKSPYYLVVNIADEYVENPQTKRYARVRITAQCFLDRTNRTPTKRTEERINSVDYYVTSEGNCFRKAQASRYVNNTTNNTNYNTTYTGTYGNIVFGIALSTSYLMNEANVTFRQGDRSFYNDVYFSFSPTVKRDLSKFKIKREVCAFYLGTDGQIHFRWGT